MINYTPQGSFADGFGAPAGQRTGLSSTRDQSSWSQQFQRQLDVLGRELQSMPRFAQSVNLQTRWRTGFDPNYFDKKFDNRSKLIQLKGAMWEELEWFVFRYRQQFEAIVENENNNFDFFHGYQWSDTELKRLQEARLIPHVSNYMSRWARTIVGEERGAETMYNFTSDDPSFKLVTDLYNQVVPRFCRMNEWGDRSSDFFFNGVVGQRGFASVRPDPYDPFRKILMRNERPQEFMYDVENAWDGTLDGCNYLLRVFFKDLEELIFEYPEAEPELRAYDNQAFEYEHLLHFTLAMPKVPPTANKRVVMVPTKFQNYSAFRRRRAAWVMEFYRRGGLKQWVVRDANYNIDHDFDTVQQAADFFRNLRAAYIAQNVAMTGNEGLDLVVPPQLITRQVVDKELWCGNVLLDVQTNRGSRFPYVPFHPEFHQGEMRGFFQDDKSNQQLRNRMLIYWDMLLGGVKGKTLVHKSLFPKGTTDEQIQEWVRDPNKILVGNWNKDEDPGRLIHHIQPPNHGTLPQTIMEYVDKASAFGNGGLNAIGDAEFAGQSDKLRRGLQVSSQTGAVGMLKEWERTERRVAQNLVYTAQFLHPTVLLEYTNSDERAQFVPLLQEEGHSIELDQIAIEVTETLAGPTKRDQQVALLLEAAGEDPDSRQDIMPLVLRMKDIPEDRIQEIEAKRQARQDAQSQQAQQEQATEQFEVQEKWRLAERKVDIEEGHLEVKKNPPIDASIVWKTSDPGPDATAAIFAQHNIAAEPDLVAASGAKQRLIDQTADNLRQDEFNSRDLEYQKGLAKIYPPGAGKQGDGAKSGAKKGGSQKSEGVRSPKDRSARQRKGPEGQSK